MLRGARWCVHAAAGDAWRRRRPSCRSWPPIALGVGIQVVALRLGLGDAGGVMLAHLIPAAGYVTLYFVGALRGGLSLEDEARTLGATRWQTTWRVTIPVLRSRLRDARARRPGVVGSSR
jgi:ABC-type uncharacterized transport system YnjBCD permease subunit